MTTRFAIARSKTYGRPRAPLRAVRLDGDDEWLIPDEWSQVTDETEDEEPEYGDVEVEEVLAAAA